MRKVLSLLFLIVLGYGGWLFFENYSYIMAFFEREEPVLQIIAMPKGIGISPAQATIKISDTGAGLGELVIRASQAGSTKELMRKSYQGIITHSDQISFEIPGREAGFRAQPVEISFIVADCSFWSNTRREATELPVSYVRPRIEPLTTQHNVAQGGVSLAFFKITAGNEFESGVKVGRFTFPAYQAKLLAPAFENSPDLYFAFFALPTDFLDRDDIKAYVVDQVGNSSTSPLAVRILQKRYSQMDTQLSAGFIQRMADRLLPGYGDLLARLDNKTFDGADLSSNASPQLLAERFRVINEDYRALLARELAPIFKASQAKKLWQGVFGRPLSGAPTAPFGEGRRYIYQGIEAGASIHDGIDLASTAGDVVRAANSGVVAAVGDLGIYGTSVIVDHGFGLFSMYSHLSAALVDQGQVVQKDMPVGRTGQTGLAGGDHLHYEMRLHGLPIRPVEWWDAAWIRDHIDEKVADIAEFAGKEYAPRDLNSRP